MLKEGKAVLALGNILNGSSFRGAARGFQLDALLKVFSLQVDLYVVLILTIIR